MKKIMTVLLTFLVTMTFTSCNNPSQKTASAAERTPSTVTGVSSVPANVEETSSAPTSAVEPPESVSSEQAPASSPSSTVPPVTSEPSQPSTCTHPDYWEGRSGLIFGWKNKKPGIEHKFTLFAECEEPRQVIYKCPVCLEPVLAETLEPTGHDFSGEEEVLIYPTVNNEGSWGIKCQRIYCPYGKQLTTPIPKRGGSYDTVDACFTVNIDSDNHLESYDTENDTISILDKRTWGSVPTIEFDLDTYTGFISYVLQDGTLYRRPLVVDKAKLSEGWDYIGKLLESGEYRYGYYRLGANGAAPE